MPGGVVTTPGNDNKHLYNGGSEWQNDYGNMPDYYQTYYRNYDAAIGRWVGVDPNPESAESMTVYQYGGNNPVLFNDPLGDKARLPETIPSPPPGGFSGSNVESSNLVAGDMANEFGTGYGGIPIYGGSGYATEGAYNSFWSGVFKSSGLAIYGYTLPATKPSMGNINCDKCRTDLYFDTNGKLISQSSYEGDGSRHFYSATVTGTDHGKVKYYVNGEVTELDIHWRQMEIMGDDALYSYRSFKNAIAGPLHSAWNSDFARGIINDDIGVHVGATLVPTVGAGYSYNVDWITRGPDLGLHMSQSLSVRAGEEAGVSAMFVHGNYNGPVSEINYGSQGGWGGDVNGELGPVSIGGWRSVSLEGGQIKTLWTGTSLGTGFGLGGSGGVSYTWVTF